MDKSHSENTSRYTKIELGNEVLPLIDHLNATRDAAGLRLLHGILTGLTMQEVVDKTTNFIDLADYSITLAEAIDGNSYAAEQAKGHRVLIDNDFKQS